MITVCYSKNYIDKVLQEKSLGVPIAFLTETWMGMGSTGTLQNLMGVAGILWGQNKIAQDSRGNVAMFDFYSR